MTADSTVRSEPRTDTRPGPSESQTPLIGQMMLSRQLITEPDLHAALEDQRSSGRRLGEILVDMGALSAVDLTAVLAERLGVGFVNLATTHPAADPSIAIPEEMARCYCALPILRKGDRVVVAMAAPDDVIARDDLRRLLEAPVHVMMAEHEQLRQAIARFYRPTEARDDTDLNLDEMQEGTQPITVLDDDPEVRLIDDLIEAARAEGASDIHIELPRDEDIRIRFRTDGVLRQASEVAHDSLRTAVRRIKALANIRAEDPAGLPAHGRFSLAAADALVHIGVTTIPTLDGEAVVLRLCDSARAPVALEALGMQADQRDMFERALSRPAGGILVSGPVRSGKTATLYAALNELNRVERSVVSIDDAGEHRLPGVNQMHLDPGCGTAFASALRSILQADPDVVMIGELRDSETARLFCEASVAGQLALAGLRATSASAALLRLIDMGVEPHVVGSAISCVVSQRLVRTLCDASAERCMLPAIVAQRLGLPDEAAGSARTRQPVGCAECHETGYNGVTALYEVMTVTEEIAELVVARASAREIERYAIAGGMSTLYAAAVRGVCDGDLAIEEIAALSR